MSRLAEPVRTVKPKRIALNVRGLMGHQELFRLSGSATHNPAVDRWFEEQPGELRSLARNWFEVMRACGDDVRELIHDGCPVACIADVPFAYVNTFKTRVNVGFFYGSMLEDRAGLLEGTGKRMRHVKLKPGFDFNTSALRALIAVAYVDVEARLKQEESSL